MGKRWGTTSATTIFRGRRWPNPRLLILRQATEGLAPVIRAETGAVLAALKAGGRAILPIDQTLSAVSRLANRMVVLEMGRSLWPGASGGTCRGA